MNLVDILIWLILAGFVVKGFSKGLIRQVCSLLGFLVGGFAALKYHAYLADASRNFIQLPSHVATILAFICIFLIVGLLFFLLGHLLTVIFRIVLLGGVNRLGGIALGALEGAFILCLVLYAGASKQAPEKIRGYILKSRSAEPFISTGREIVAGWGTVPLPGFNSGKAKRVSTPRE